MPRGALATVDGSLVVVVSAITPSSLTRACRTWTLEIEDARERALVPALSPQPSPAAGAEAPEIRGTRARDPASATEPFANW
jgi:hypothetical protein